MTPERRLALARLIALLAVIAISIYIFSIRDQAEELAKYGYPGIFLLSILANATVLLPAPGVLFVFTMGAVFDPFWVAIAAGAGAALGELSGYLAGFSGQAVVENMQYYERLSHWMEAHPRLSNLAITVLAFIPNPFFDLAGVAAGALKIPVGRFLFFCVLGKILKMLLFAYAGANWLNRIFTA
ncbi:MAG: VTT domain-containing protein [Anaerolineales bacterium]|nr:VTT domain-containing protein [Anaerolineales bacterium]